MARAPEASFDSGRQVGDPAQVRQGAPDVGGIDFAPALQMSDKLAARGNKMIEEINEGNTDRYEVELGKAADAIMANTLTQTGENAPGAAQRAMEEYKKASADLAAKYLKNDEQRKMGEGKKLSIGAALQGKANAHQVSEVDKYNTGNKIAVRAAAFDMMGRAGSDREYEEAKAKALAHSDALHKKLGIAGTPASDLENKKDISAAARSRVLMYLRESPAHAADLLSRSSDDLTAADMEVVKPLVDKAFMAEQAKAIAIGLENTPIVDERTGKKRQMTVAEQKDAARAALGDKVTATQMVAIENEISKRALKRKADVEIDQTNAGVQFWAIHADKAKKLGRNPDDLDVDKTMAENPELVIAMGDQQVQAIQSHNRANQTRAALINHSAQWNQTRQLERMEIERTIAALNSITPGTKEAIIRDAFMDGDAETFNADGRGPKRLLRAMDRAWDPRVRTYLWDRGQKLLAASGSAQRRVQHDAESTAMNMSSKMSKLKLDAARQQYATKGPWNGYRQEIVGTSTEITAQLADASIVVENDVNGWILGELAAKRPVSKADIEYAYDAAWRNAMVKVSGADGKENRRLYQTRYAFGEKDKFGVSAAGSSDPDQQKMDKATVAILVDLNGNGIPGPGPFDYNRSFSRTYEPEEMVEKAAGIRYAVSIGDEDELSRRMAVLFDYQPTVEEMPWWNTQVRRVMYAGGHWKRSQVEPEDQADESDEE
jgi:hypothetical protein